MSILDQIEQSRSRGFVPESPDEFLALRLAVRLGEPEAAQHYLMLVSQYPQEFILGSYRWAKRRQGSGRPLGKLFHEAISQQTASLRPQIQRTVAIAVERRHVSGAVFLGAHLEDVRTKHLPGQPEKMAGSAVGLIRSILSEHRIEAAALEQPRESRIRAIKTKVVDAVALELRSQGLPLWRFEWQTVISAFGHPSPKKRTDLRLIASRMWPDATGHKPPSTMPTALALGLYAQTERVFSAAEH
jgi:hypothetical protein